MARNLIYTANTTSTAVPIGDAAPIGSVIHRYGSCLDASGSTVNVKDPGYYEVNVSATFTAAAAGDVTLSLQRDGVTVSGATATATITTASTETANIGITAVVRVMCCGNARLSVLVSGTAAPTITNMAIGVVRV